MQLALPRLLLILAAFATLTHAAGRFADDAFPQETHQSYRLGAREGANDVGAVCVAEDQTVWAATRAGVYARSPSQPDWTAPASTIGNGSTYCLARRGSDMLVGAWNGLHRGHAGKLDPIPSLNQPVIALYVSEERPTSTNPMPFAFALGPDGLWQIHSDGKVSHRSLPFSRQVNSFVPGGRSDWWIATGLGLYHWRPKDSRLHQGPHETLSAEVRSLALDPQGRIWAGCLGGLALYQEGDFNRWIPAEQALPSSEVQCVSRVGPEMWIGTRQGIARHIQGRWSIRHSQRWLAHDDVRCIWPDPAIRTNTNQGKVWIATAAGISAIQRQPMTLADKASHYLNALRTRHVRPPGIVEKCRLRIPGDLGSWEPEDDDNDGGYTAVYLAMESFRYAATRNPNALANAKAAFGTLRFLQSVTGTPGFIARSVLPAQTVRMHDPNETLSDAERARRRAEDPRFKYVPERWRTSADGRWLWKGDTSSDEITAHMFGCLYFHELAADEAEKARISEFVSRIIGGIAEAGYVLKDLDGQATRWAVWSPEKLLRDPDWSAEAGVNAVEILSFLRLAYHITGQESFHQRYLELIRQHGYGDLVLRCKTVNPSVRTHIDDELLAFAWPALLMFETEPALRQLYRQAFESWHGAVRLDHNPFFECLYAGLTGDASSISTSIDSLRDQPLDLVRWTVDNSRREDVRLVRKPELETWQTDRLLPPSERGVMRTDDNPWRAIQGDGGHTESDGVFWLLPYWMARHYNIL